MTDAATLLPPNATDLDRAAASLIAEISAIPVPVRDVWNPYTCQESLLPWLAWAFGVDEWNDEWTQDVKRDVIAQSIQIKRYKGTIGAVQRAITAMGIEARVQTWYQQTPPAAPYTFRVLVEANQSGFSNRQLATINAVIERYKNLRSHLAGIELAIRSDDALTLASIALVGMESETEDGTPRYTDGISALDFMVDGAVNGYSLTSAAADQVSTILASMPAKLSIPADL